MWFYSFSNTAKMSKLMNSALSSALLMVCLAACSSRTKNPPEHLNMDSALRQFLDVRSILAIAQVPDTDAAYLLTVFEFEDGKLARRGPSSYGKAEMLPGRTLKAQLLWSTATPTMCLVGSSMSAKSTSNLWQKLDGGWASSGSGITNGDYEGFRVLGFAQSDLRRDGGKNSSIDPDFRGAVERQKYVGALAIKTFKTQEEASREAQPK